METKYVYSFSEGSKEMKSLLGGKGVLNLMGVKKWKLSMFIVLAKVVKK